MNSAVASTEGNSKTRTFSGFPAHACRPRQSFAGFSSLDAVSDLKKSPFSDKGPVRPDAPKEPKIFSILAKTPYFL
jgi:hypothetical protein